tara:strand:+ start:6992 stop:7138 length:147 start_codon:yes stop_codon:yes gene_type:complete
LLLLFGGDGSFKNQKGNCRLKNSICNKKINFSETNFEGKKGKKREERE